MKDLTFTCVGAKGQNIYCAFDTVMDFLEEVEEKKISDDVVNGSNFKATYFENELNTFACDNFDALYKHSNAIVS